MPDKRKYSVEIQPLAPSDCLNGQTHRALLYAHYDALLGGGREIKLHKLGGSALQSVNNLRALYLAGRHKHTKAECEAIQAALDAAQKGIEAK